MRSSNLIRNTLKKISLSLYVFNPFVQNKKNFGYFYPFLLFSFPTRRSLASAIKGGLSLDYPCGSRVLALSGNLLFVINILHIYYLFEQYLSSTNL